MRPGLSEIKIATNTRGKQKHLLGTEIRRQKIILINTMDNLSGGQKSKHNLLNLLFIQLWGMTANLAVLYCFYRVSYS
jgi:hypothetical protein